MKKISTLLFLLAVFSYTVNGQGSFTTFKSAVSGVAKTQSVGISPNGKYVTGNTISEESKYKHMFVWTLEDGIKEWDANNENEVGDGSRAYSISNTGLVFGLAPNPAVKPFSGFLNSNTGDSIFAKMPSAAFAKYGEDKWEFLPTLQTREDGGYSYGFSDYVYAGAEEYDGVVFAVGAMPVNGKMTSVVPVRWDIRLDGIPTSRPRIFKMPEGTTSGRAKSVNASAGLVGGEINSIPTLWNSFDLEEIKGLSGKGSVTAFSYNANMIINDTKGYMVMDIDNKGALYDFANKTLIYLQTTHDANGCYPLAVSDNGVVVGHIGGKAYMGSPSPKTAFIYTEKMGLKKLSDFLREAGIDYSGTLEAVTGISADGTKLVGYGGANSFYIEIPAITEGAYPARGINLENKKYGEVTVTWTAAPDDAANPRTGYKVYHNGTLLETVAADATSYIHAGIADGEHKYYVTAVYGDTESRPTATASTMMAKAEFPFYDAFNTYGVGSFGSPTMPLSTGGWDVSWNTVASADKSWQPSIGGFYQGCLFYWTQTTGVYNEYAASPYFDLSDAEDAWLSFVIQIAGNNVENNNKEFLAIEAFDGQEWVAIDTIECKRTQTTFPYLNYVPYKVDLTEQLAGNPNARFRIVAFGNATETGGDVNWKIDNLDFYDTKRAFAKDGVSAVSATQWKNENDGSEVVYINWADPNETARLRYITGAFGDWWASKIGNEGAPFIAANMYPAEELAIYEGYKLTSISFMPSYNSSISSAVTAKYKWFVSQGGERLYSEDVTGDLKALEYKTIELETPIAIDVNKPLYYGVEIVSHGMDDLPIATADVFHYVPEIHPITGEPTGMHWATSYNVADGRGNIYSEDGGKTWKTIGAYTGDGGTEVYQLFAIRAEIMKDPAKGVKDRILGYSIYRNGIDIYHEIFEGDRALSPMTTFIDVNPLVDQEATYEVVTEYFTLDKSEAKEVKIVFTPNSINENVDANGFITVTPTLAVNYVNIEGEFVKATMYDVNGKVVAETSNNQISVGSLPAGTYIVKINTSKGEVTKKIIVKK
ncbi:hypothetical protein M2132_002358 [Dysgonomonas sp. PH5-45]|uniref:T9SS type A sorting domain-containing protein n=1 Tax=unclassified Dysgonomonas TaxID=2630389 RepID=UPI002475FBCF|nr:MULTISPECIES: T9SS type A sorting domain-containing protein [unclassified Dysgonomonas]MDH6356006.1 hypothetical protein [Dysgonomonas sp. PH5-45]MDH6388897.1 hypothetical protein [Dysgonomonas sp. PH5-37]